MVDDDENQIVPLPTARTEEPSPPHPLKSTKSREEAKPKMKTDPKIFGSSFNRSLHLFHAI